MIRRMIALLCSGLMLHTTVALAKEENPLTPQQQKAVEASRRFLAFVDQPETRTYRQVLQSMKPFAPTELIEWVEKESQSSADEQFPPMKTTDRGDTLEVKIGSKKFNEVLLIRKNDSRVFATFRGVEILWADMKDGTTALKKMEAATREKKSALRVLLLPEAEAFWGLVLGLGLVGAGIAAGMYFLSRAKTKHTVQVQGTTTHDVNVPTDYTVNTEHAFTVPQLDPYLKADGAGKR